MNEFFAVAAKPLAALTVIAGLALTSSVAHAKKDCWISSRTHEKVCMTTSDGPGQPYKDARSAKKSKAEQAMEIAHARQKRAEARAKRWPWR